MPYNGVAFVQAAGRSLFSARFLDKLLQKGAINKVEDYMSEGYLSTRFFSQKHYGCSVSATLTFPIREKNVRQK